ncbi:potassium channel family protein [Nocardioides plantarum]|uniref:Potassium channel family protein n=1 Tax=Nocardioides plantarum TaxID=29299 RepID=A0ABV5KFS0_9ACTN|nr:potassium channel family protein [Nocardioides plantarum]
MTERSADRVAAWERRSEIPLLLLAVAFLVAYAWPVLDPTLDAGVEDSLRAVSWTVWVAFVLDVAIRLVLADHRVRYARQHWWDIALVALPMLRPLRLLRLLAFARLLHRSARVNLVGRVGIYVSGTAVAAVGLGAIAVLDAEREAPDATITTFGDAVWWAVTTVSTVGYGDLYPVTTTGRLVATVLMIVGIAVVGTVTATVAAWLIAEVADQPAEPPPTR